MGDLAVPVGSNILSYDGYFLRVINKQEDELNVTFLD
jgi:hypothetical protein